MTGNDTTTQYLHRHCYICDAVATMQQYNGINPTFTFYYKTARLASFIKQNL